MKNEKLYNPEKTNSLIMQFGGLVRVMKKKYEYYKRDKRIKKYRNQRTHDGVIGKYKENVKKT